ncbi:hypothetical protein OEZ85_013580 [Tetradesmus obliquus]|uniref:Septin-type G domain-containing protein n=1 Tax=Tetradesmus obliquus TaxID=3088 RepID=A0ABY8URS4_TETOB|nr:hypothetical protein OEZ85_013580 [Tetradesmus obliquus]
MAPEKKNKSLFASFLKSKDPVVGSQLTKDKAASVATPVALPAKPATAEPAKATPVKASPPAPGVVSSPVRVSASSGSSAASATPAYKPVSVPSPSAAPVKSGRAAAVPVETPSLARLRADDARAAWQARPSIPVRLLDNYINFMVMGESGLGKTTFINNLVSSYRTTRGQPHDGSTTSLSAFQADPDSLKTVLEPMEVSEAGRRLHVTVQDMPGWGDDINLVRYLRVVVDFILQARMKDYEMLAGSRGLNEAAMCGQLQHSITACVYFLSPHRVKKVDLIIMSALSQLVTVIPVIAKADTMTDKELSSFRSEVRAMLSCPSKYAPSKTLAPLDFNTFGFAPQVLTDLGITPDAMPLALITSNEHESLRDSALAAELGLDQPEVQQPVRNYRWGAAYALNREHSDLLTLKRLLLGDKVDSLYAMLDESYNRYLNFCQQYEANGKQLPLIVQNAAAMCTPYLEYDDYSNAKTALDSAQQAMSTLMAENKALMERINVLERSGNMSRY